MNRLFSVMLLVLAAFCSVPASAKDSEPSPSSAEPQRELIYCADLMTSEEREAYRELMRAARTPQEQSELRAAHQEQMHARARELGLDPVECEPLRMRESLNSSPLGDKP